MYIHLHRCVDGWGLVDNESMRDPKDKMISDMTPKP